MSKLSKKDLARNQARALLKALDKEQGIAPRKSRGSAYVGVQRVNMRTGLAEKYYPTLAAVAVDGFNPCNVSACSKLKTNHRCTNISSGGYFWYRPGGVQTFEEFLKAARDLVARDEAKRRESSRLMRLARWPRPARGAA